MTWTTPAGKAYNFHMDLLKQPHLLIAGATGSGKSVILNGIIYNALYNAPSECALILCDPKRVELRKYKDLPHVLRFANDVESINEALQYAHAVMMDRFHQMELDGLAETTERDIYIVVDEFADLITTVKGGDRELNQIKNNCNSLIESIGRLGRAAHVHLILATQSPDRNTIQAHIVQNMTAKLALRCDSPIESRQIIGTKGAELLPMYGEAYYKTPASKEPVHVQNIPYFTADVLQERVDWWTSQQPAQTKRPCLFRRLFGAA